MKLFWATGICLLIFSAVIRAETMYINDIVRITLRTGPGTDNKIIAMIQSGQEVEVLETGDEWTYVRLPDGREGWVINYLLTSKIPNCLILEQVKKKREALMVQSASLLENNTKLKAENKTAQSEIAQKETMLIQLGQSYETLKTESADFLKLKSKYDKVLSQLAEQTEKAERLEKKLTSFEKHRAVMWFLAGAGVLLVGFLIGFSIKQRQRLFLR